MRVIRCLLAVTEVSGATGFVSFKRMKPVVGVVLMLFLFSTAALAARGVGTADYEDEEDTGIVQPREPRMISPGRGVEEDSNTIFTSDEVITGDVTGYSTDKVSVDGVNHSICSSVKVFTSKGAATTVDNLETAERVKLFIGYDKSCIRKIKILRSVH